MKGRVNMTVLILLVTVGFTEELTWNTKMRATVCCQGSKQLLIWNFTEGENERVTELHWFFNEKTLICLESETTGLIVSDLYKGRVVRNGTAGILLKNVSFNDAGEYTLYVKLEEEKERNVQGINLTVVESPPDQCKPIIEKKHPKGIISCYTSCERSPLSLEWIINGTQDPVGIEPYFVVDSSWTSEQLFCCLRDFKCHDDDQFKFCTPNHISFTEDMHTVNQSIADTNHMVFTSMLIFLVITQMAVIVIAGFILKRRCGSCHKRHYTGTLAAKHRNEQELLEMSEPENLNTVGQCKKNLQQVNTVAVTTVASEPKYLNTKKQCNEELEDVHAAAATTVAVEPKNSNTVAQCNEDLQQTYIVAAVTDRPLQDSNQHVQIVNNISIDSDFLKSILHSNTALTAELKASKKEIMKLKRQLCHITDSRKKQNRHKYFEMTKVKCSDFKDYDTNTLETSDFEDASSELLVHPNRTEGIVSCQSQGYSSGSQHGLSEDKTTCLTDRTIII